MVVIDGNHRVSVMRQLLKESKRPDKNDCFKYVNAVIMDPMTDIAALEKIGRGKKCDQRNDDIQEETKQRHTFEVQSWTDIDFLP